MNRLVWIPALAYVLIGCSEPPGESATEQDEQPVVQQVEVLPTLPGAVPFQWEDIPYQDENVRDDTLLVYTTHKLDDGTYVMAARNVQETRDGLRLYQYRPNADSTAELIAVSKPAYDSEVMLPTYFRSDDPDGGYIILANYGAADSWGQNVFLLKDGRFQELGWLDVTLGKWKEGPDGTERWLVGIGPATRVFGNGDEYEFAFATDSIYLYDDLQGGRDLMISADRVRYRYDGQEMVLYIDGAPRYREGSL